jgi:hypothetical protein
MKSQLSVSSPHSFKSTLNSALQLKIGRWKTTGRGWAVRATGPGRVRGVHVGSRPGREREWAGAENCGPGQSKRKEGRKKEEGRAERRREERNKIGRTIF